MCSHLSLYKFGEHMGLLFVNHSTDQYSPLDFLLSCSTDLRSRLRRNKDSRDPKVSEEQEIEKSKVTHTWFGSSIWDHKDNEFTEKEMVIPDAKNQTSPV